MSGSKEFQILFSHQRKQTNKPPKIIVILSYFFFLVEGLTT